MYSEGLTRDKTGKRTDKTGKRDLSFSQWHRKFLGNQCYATDIDFLEYRIQPDGTILPKAFIEIKQAHVKQSKYLCSTNTRAIWQVARQLGMRFFIILYKLIDKESLKSEFWVWEVSEEKQFEEYSMDRFHLYFKKFTNEELIQLFEAL